ncbi:MAG: phosphoribosylglycinamide formyltransferase [Gemmatimonadota bacterium]|nr:phosphoribosylglycinamide formyltransferase [Gemmatimonadota bacterium]
MSESVRIAVLASGGGSNLQALLERFPPGGSASAQVVLAVGGRAGIGALPRADAAGVATAVIEAGPGEGERLAALLEGHGAELVVLAGYLRRVPPEVVRRWDGRMVNVHPALLPAFAGAGMYGMHVHRAVLASGARVSGATVHRVGDAYDSGPILAQWPVPVLPDDTPERLAARVLAVEHRLLPGVVEALCRWTGESASGEVAQPTFGLVNHPAPSDAEVRRLLAQRFSSSPR